jgi:hypothetical protein
VKSITIVHDGKWLGGQYTEQALACVDENKGVSTVGWGVDWHPMKRSFHRSGLFKELMDGIEAFNTQKYGSPMPGRPWHGPSTFRPVEAEAVFRKLLQPYVDNGQVRLIWNRYPVRADIKTRNERKQLTGLWFAPIDGEKPDLHLTARVTIDASDWGEAIQVSGAAYECGPDPKSRYNEPSAPDDLSANPPNEMNPITWAMIVEESKADTPIPKPPRYDDRNFVRTTRFGAQAMSGLHWDRPVRLGGILHWPDAGKASPRQLSIYTVRRIVDGYTSKDKTTSILLNYMLGQDYPLERLPQHVVDALEATERGASRKNIVRLSRRQRQIIFDDAKRHSLCLHHHLQTYVHDRAPDKTHSFRRFRLSDEFGPPDKLPPKPYIRESLRLKAAYMMREQDGRNADGKTKQQARERFSRVMYPDGLFAWQFHYDFHRTGRAYLRDVGQSGPWIDSEKLGRHTRHVSDRSVFPLRSLIPQEMDGLLGAQKNVGYSSIVSAAIRLHDQCVTIGQAAGAAAAVALRHETQPRSLLENRSLLEEVRHALCGEVSDGSPVLIWPYRDLPAKHPAFVAINRLAARGDLPMDPRAVDFKPDARADGDWKEQVVALTAKQLEQATLPKRPGGTLSRGEFCRRWWNLTAKLPVLAYKRLSADDADKDGIPDIDDPTPFLPGDPVRWGLASPPADQDGLPSASLTNDKSARCFNFIGKGSKPVAGFTSDIGLPFDETRGHGWGRNIGGNNRRRNVYPESQRDTFLFTRGTDRWECVVPNGKWTVTVCVGDSGHEQVGQTLAIEGVVAIKNANTTSGWFIERTVIVEVKDGRLTLDLGTPDRMRNTCLNWVYLIRS